MDFLEFIKMVKSNHIVGVVGDLGDGKSIVGVAVVVLLRTLSLATREPLNIVSNIPLNCEHSFIEYYDQLDNVFNSLIFIDEIHLIADSRNSHSGTNFFTSGVTVAVRKRKCNMLWTSQESSQVELRVKNRTTLFLNPEKLTNDPLDLRFKINLVSKNRKLLGDIVLNLDPYKDFYSTYYIPLPLIDRNEDEPINKKMKREKDYE